MPARSRTHARVVLVEEPKRPARPPRRLERATLPSESVANPMAPPSRVLVADESGSAEAFYEMTLLTERDEGQRLLDRAERKQRAPERQSLRARIHELHYRGEFYAWRQERAAEGPAWYASLAVMLLAVATLGVMAVTPDTRSWQFMDGTPDLAEAIEPVFLRQSVIYNENLGALEVETAEAPLSAPTAIAITWADSGLAPVERSAAESVTPAEPAKAQAFGLLAVNSPEMLRRVGSVPEGRLAHRDPRLRAQLLDAAGGTVESERAVSLGLGWLAARQLADGSWPADESAMQDNARGEPKTAATALALLPFLGAGSSTERGWHRETVERGVRYLASRLPANASLVQPAASAAQLEARALTALALAEAYALTSDRALGESAQVALDVLAVSQDSISGGWRTAGGTAASPQLVAWHVAALTTAREAGLRTTERTMAGVAHYYHQQGLENRAIENVITAHPNPAGDAAGVLARAQLAGEEAAAVEETLAWLAARGPDRKDAEFNLHATHALYRLKSPAWPAWNGVLRDQLVGAQFATGADRGSWLSAPGASRQRETSLTVLTLQVYYRTDPLTSDVDLGE